jgi:hypothetical protein
VVHNAFRSSLDADPSASLKAREEFEFARLATLAPSEELLSHEETGSDNQNNSSLRGTTFSRRGSFQRNLEKIFFFSENGLSKERA